MNSQRLYETLPNGERRYLSDAELDAARNSAKVDDGRTLQVSHLPRRSRQLRAIGTRTNVQSVNPVTRPAARSAPSTFGFTAEDPRFASSSTCRIHRAWRHGRRHGPQSAQARLLTAVWNRTAGKAQAHRRSETGCIAAQSLADLAPRCDVIVMCVSADRRCARASSTACCRIRIPTRSSSTARRSAPTQRASAAHRLRERGAIFSTRPSAAASKARATAPWRSWCGGECAAFERARPVLEAMGRTITHFGASGAGQAAKATNQIMCAGVIQAVAEAMAFAKSQRTAARQADRNARQGRGIELVFRQSRAEYRPRQLSGGLPRALA